MKSILKYIIVFVILIIVFLVALVVSALFPRDWIENKTLESAKTLNNEGSPKNIVIGMNLDNYTDTIMINTAYSINPEKPFESILLDRKNNLPEIEQTYYTDVNGELKTSKNTFNNVAVELFETVANKDTLETFEYARYWHGYLIWLRPMLIFFNINDIKLIIETILVFLGIYFIVILSKKISSKILFIVLIGMICADFFLMGLTFQGVTVYIISIVASILICKRCEKIKDIGLYFFIIGIFTSFFDLLSTPIITLGLPIITYLLLRPKQGLKDNIKIIIKSVILWGIGYILTYFSKWVLVDLFYNRGLILKALQQFFYRSQATEGHVTWYNGICNNLIRAEIRIGIYTTFIIVLLLVLLVKNYKKIYIDIKKSLPYLIVSLMPFAWYLLMNNHSTYHSFFTYRALMVFYIGFGVFLVNLFNTEKNTPKETIKKGEEE